MGDPLHRLRAQGRGALSVSAKVPRVLILVCDSFGVGDAPDAAAYGDEGSDTLGNTATAVGGIAAPNLGGLGLGLLTTIEGVEPRAEPGTAHGRLTERSAGKDTTTGHWEMAGIVLAEPFPLYPDGFPPEVIEPFEAAIGREVLGNVPASGTEIIADLGEEQLRTGRPIVYTSGDSVFQIATHTDVVPLPTLYEWSRTARRLLVPPHNVGRVIARPFDGPPGAFVRRPERRDFSVPPPGPTLLDRCGEAGVAVFGVGKIQDIFAQQGLTEGRYSDSNDHGRGPHDRLPETTRARARVREPRRLRQQVRAPQRPAGLRATRRGVRPAGARARRRAGRRRAPADGGPRMRSHHALHRPLARAHAAARGRTARRVRTTSARATRSPTSGRRPPTCSASRGTSRVPASPRSSAYEPRRPARRRRGQARRPPPRPRGAARLRPRVRAGRDRRRPRGRVPDGDLHQRPGRRRDARAHARDGRLGGDAAAVEGSRARRWTSTPRAGSPTASRSCSRRWPPRSVSRWPSSRAAGWATRAARSTSSSRSRVCGPTSTGGVRAPGRAGGMRRRCADREHRARGRRALRAPGRDRYRARRSP